MALIVAAEDDADVADLLTLALGRAGHTVHVVPTGQLALDLIAERRPDLVILDHQMPGITGLDVGRRLRADAATAGLPMLMLSAYAPDDADEVFDQVMHMPVSLWAVAEAARDLLATTGRHRQATPRPLTDPERLHSVSELLTDPDPLDDLDLTLIAANVAALTGAGAAAINLVLNDITLTLASTGLPDLLTEAGGIPIEWTPCGVVAGSNRAVVITDLAADPVFHGTPLTWAGGIRSYAGVPLHAPDGLVVGTLSVLDAAPIGFTTRTVRRLTMAAPELTRLLDRRRG
jgi:CheY-like chemotaxis protein